jgi:hypothetical protein
MDQTDYLIQDADRKIKKHFSSYPNLRIKTTFYTGWPYVVLGSIILFLSAFFLWPSYREFPIDDAYIHFVYAENLASHGRLLFNYGHESGLGVTSPLWVLLLSAGRLMGLPIHLTAKFFGVLSLVIVSCFLYYFVLSHWPRTVALATALLVGISGNMIWFALSGMETMLFLAVGLGTLWFYQQQKMAWVGIFLGLLVLLRPEGLALMVTIVLLKIARRKSWGADLWAMIIICGLICGPWFIYLYWRTGYVLPTSAIGKQVSFQVGVEQVTNNNSWIFWIAKIPSLVYVGSWIVFLVMFTLGGMAFPGPSFRIGEVVNNPDYTLSLWSLIGLILIIMPLLFAVIRRSWAIREHSFRKAYLRYPTILSLVLWAFLHNILYMIYMPIPGTASRYGAINHMLLWLILTLGLFIRIRNNPRSGWLLVGLIIISVTNIRYWNEVYDANLEHMQKVRIAAANYLQQQHSNEICAAFDIGAIRYFSQKSIVDLGGLTDPRATRQFLSGTFDHYLLEHGVTCLILPGRMKTTREGWFDMAHVMGFDTSSLFDMEQIMVFEIDRERWLIGYLPTNNYQSSVTIYRIEPTAGKY